MDKKFYKSVFIFTPIFISTSGIYQREITQEGLQQGETGFVFPLIFFIAILYFLLMIIKFLKSEKIYANKYYTFLFSLVFIYTLTASLIGYIVYDEFVIILRWFQFISLLLGIIIFYWLIFIKKINTLIFLKSLFYFILFLIILHFISSVIEIGLINSITSISPNLFFFGIYQSRVYYPYLIVVMFFLSILSIKNAGLKNISILLIIGYVFSLQVRGAFLSLLVFLILYFILIHKQKIISLIVLVFFSFLLMQNTTFIYSYDFGRFEDIEQLFTLSGRLSIWLDDLQTDSLFSFFFGNLFFDQDQYSSHNQFIHFYKYGGMVLILLFILAIIPFFNNLRKQIKNKNKQGIFLMMLFFVPLFIDLNLNVPLNNINSGIIYLFVWSLILYLSDNNKNRQELFSDKP